jgi:EAL and modified HD-GYP domain-containing signal transduction protein
MRANASLNFLAHCADRFEVTSASSAPSLNPGKPVPQPGTQFVARQPILTADEKVFGYELLFRDGIEDFFQSSDLDAASRSAVSTSMLLGFDVLCEGHLAFVNCTRNILLKDYITLLPSSQTVVEVLETVPADALVVAACRRLKESGYLIALDDFAVDDPRETLTDLADIIKVDLRATSGADAAAMVRRYGSRRCRMLAEKVETREEFTAAKKAEFQYFQGYFFRRPETITSHDIPANQLNYVRMLAAVSQPELDVREIENLVKGEASLCYRLLRYLNSAAFGFSAEIHSVRHALSILGEREVRRWICLVATLAAGQGRTSDLVHAVLVRARFCELLSPRLQRGDSDLFLMGMLSLMNSILRIPMRQVLDNVPVDLESKAVLLGEPSPLRPFYQLMLARECGDWKAVSELSSQLHLTESEVAECYWQAMQWARQVTAQT